MELLLGIDLGTSYFKVGLFDRDGTMRGLGRIAVEPERTPAGRVELAVPRFWERLRRGLAEALAQAGAVAADVVGVSYSSQANTFVLLDAADVPLTPLVLWTDTRPEVVPEAYAAFAARADFGAATGFWGLSPESAVVKWEWCRRHLPDPWARAARLLTISDYLTYALTGVSAGDASSAALLGLYDLRARTWWPEALARFEIDAGRLVTPCTPGTRVGGTLARARDLLGLPAGVPFAVGGLDHHIAGIGAGLDDFAEASISTGTVLAAICVVEEVKPAPGCFHGLHVDGRRFYRLAFDPAGAGQLEEFQRRFAADQSIGSLIHAAAAQPPGSRPAAEPWTPDWGRDAARAVRFLLDRIAQTHRSLVLTAQGGRMPAAISATGGGARSPEWLAIKADVIGAPILTLACPERACLGAAVIAAVAAGHHASIREAAGIMVRPDRVFRPGHPRDRRPA
jgi:sugar (pentulose or hexulose) kinase